MRPRRTTIVALFGLALVAIGTGLGVVQPGDSGGAGGLVALLVLVALGLGFQTVRGSLDGTADAPTVPWAGDDAFATPAPERTDRKPPLSSDDLAGLIETAGERARDEESVDEGLEAVRPALRETLIDALEQGGRSRSEVEAALTDGSWTDDRVAASVLAADVAPPNRSFRERVRVWLSPERVVRQRARRATDAVAAAADDALPTVPGQTAPRTVPVVRPTLEDLQRGADGRLQRAVDPRAIARGPQPRRPQVGDELGDAESDGTDGRDYRAEITEETGA
ncbi:DUF7269 family protein [Natrinema marinum]|uniref:DUF7269 family protein n=1 Tax=Natrinema marinum TaxID=2961598 RepID=UPI0020C84928|nr:hypothetical protein [Natrinema marinum]